MRLLRYLGRHAREPGVAALVITAGAVVFNALWIRYAPMLVAGWSLRSPALFFVVASLNAYVATLVIWSRWVPREGEFSFERATLVGVGLGVFSMFTLAAIGVPFVALVGVILGQSGGLWGVDAIAIVGLPIELLFTGLFGTIYGLAVTKGLPVAITTAGAVGLASLEKRYQ